jgi:hypothetical protein
MIRLVAESRLPRHLSAGLFVGPGLVIPHLFSPRDFCIFRRSSSLIAYDIWRNPFLLGIDHTLFHWIPNTTRDAILRFVIENAFMDRLSWDRRVFHSASVRSAFLPSHSLSRTSRRQRGTSWARSSVHGPTIDDTMHNCKATLSPRFLSTDGNGNSFQRHLVDAPADSPDLQHIDHS